MTRKADARVALVAAAATRGGFAALSAQARDLVWAGIETIVLTGPGPDLDAVPAEAAVTVLAEEMRRSNVLACAWELARWVHRHAPTHLHLHGRAAGVVGRTYAWAARDRPMTIYTPHGGFPPPNAIERCVEGCLQRGLASRTDLFVFVGEAEERSFFAEYGLSGIPSTTMPNAVDPEAVRFLAGFGGRACEVLVPGAYHPLKGQELVLRALGLIEESERPDVVFVGEIADLGYYQHLSELAASLKVAKHVSLDGASRNLTARLAGARLVVFPSQLEGAPIAPREAASLFVPILYSDIAPHREVFGNHGCAFVSGRVDQLAEMIADRDHWFEWVVPLEHAEHLYRCEAQQRSRALARILDLGGRSVR